MISICELRGAMAKKGYNGRKMAKALDITPKTFYAKMNKGVFGSDEIEVMIETLEIKEPLNIFFVTK